MLFSISVWYVIYIKSRWNIAEQTLDEHLTTSFIEGKLVINLDIIWPTVLSQTANVVLYSNRRSSGSKYFVIRSARVEYVNAVTPFLTIFEIKVK